MDSEKLKQKQRQVREEALMGTSGKVLMTLPQAREIGRMMWEVQGLTMPQIALSMGKSTSAIEKWSRVMNWKKKSELKKEGNTGGLAVREMTRQKFLDILSDRGMPPEKAIDILVKGMTEPELEPTILEGGKDVFDQQLPDTIIRHKDHKTIHKYLHDYFIIGGAIGNPDKDSGGLKGLGSINIQVNIPVKKE